MRVIMIIILKLIIITNLINTTNNTNINYTNSKIPIMITPIMI